MQRALHGPHNPKHLHYALWLKGAVCLQVQDLQRMHLLLQALIHLFKGQVINGLLTVLSKGV